VTLNGERICNEVCDVVDPRNVMHRELLLSHTINNPVESHVHRLGHLGGNGVVGETHRTFVVTKDWSRRLRVIHVVQDVALGESETSRCEDAGVLCFSHERTNYSIRVEWGKDGMLDKMGLIVKAKVVKRCRDVSRFGPGEE
jgi:hypothetical protein